MDYIILLSQVKSQVSLSWHGDAATREAFKQKKIRKKLEKVCVGKGDSCDTENWG